MMKRNMYIWEAGGLLHNLKLPNIILPVMTALFTALSAASLHAEEVEFEYEGNPLVRHIFTADPSARVFGDRLYVYTSHDQDNSENDQHFDMLDWHVFSTADLKNWVDHGPLFSLEDISWASKQAWAPDCVQRNGKFYFYYPVEQAKIGVAVSDSPTAGFTDPLGKPLVDKTDNEAIVGREPIDPGLMIDDDGEAYMFFGCRDARYVKLKENMIELDGDIQSVIIRGIEGDEENSGGFYGEAPWIFKRNGLYYLMYSNGWGEKSTLIYATANTPAGPFTFQGEVMSPSFAGTSHGSIVEFKDKWYLFYHNHSLSNDTKRRSVCFNEITFAPDGKINCLTYISPTPDK